MKPHFCAFALIWSVSIFGQPGTLDQSFGNAGKTLFRYHQPFAALADAFVAGTDQIVATGFTFYDANLETVVMRFNADGSADAGFGTNGLVRLNFKANNFDDATNAMVQLPDGKLIVCMGTDTTVRLVRLNSNGSIDASFGSGSGVVVPLNGLEVNDMQVRAAGQLLLSGSILGVPSLVQLTPAGALDASFGNSGVETISLNAAGDFYLSSLQVMPDERLVLAGARRSAPGDTYKAMVVRLLEDATPDPSFSSDGWAELPGAENRRYNEGEVKLHSDGRIFIAGAIDDLSNNFRQLVSGFYVACFSATGMLDASFGTGGLVQYDAASNMLLGGLQLQADGKLLLAGAYRSAADYEFGVYRLLSNGQPDATFGTNGFVHQNASNGFDYGFAALRQSTGQYVVVGGGIVQHQYSLTMRRMTATGLPDNSFGGTGTVQRKLGAGQEIDESNLFAAVASTSGNQPVVAGFFNNGQLASAMLARYSSTGQLDAGFGLGGIADASFSVADVFTKLQALPDGKIMAAGTTYDLLGGSALILARFLNNGTLDASFGNGGKAMLFVGIDNQIDQEKLDMAVMPDGRVVISFSMINFSTFADSPRLARINTAGQFDTEFAGTGIKEAPFFFSHVAAQPDGKLLAAGSSMAANVSEGLNVFTTRLNSNGGTDNTFNNGQLLSTHFSEEGDYLAGLLVQPGTGKIVMAINSVNSATVGNAALAVYNSNGSPDNAFSSDGRVDIALPFDPHFLQQAADGSFLLGGSDFSQSSGRFAAARVTPGGVLDGGFGTGGVGYYRALTISDNEAFGMALQPDGKLLMAGWFLGETDNTNRAVLMRIQTAAGSSTSFSFTGTGNWSNAANWSGGQVPPNPLPAGTTVTINHAAAGQCLLDVPISVQPGASITVPNGKTFRAGANITLPAITTQ